MRLNSDLFLNRVIGWCLNFSSGHVIWESQANPCENVLSCLNLGPLFASHIAESKQPENNAHF